MQLLIPFSDQYLDTPEQLAAWKALMAACVAARTGGSSCKAGPGTQFHQACLGRNARLAHDNSLCVRTKPSRLEPTLIVPKVKRIVRHWACDACLLSLPNGMPETLKGATDPAEAAEEAVVEAKAQVVAGRRNASRQQQGAVAKLQKASSNGVDHFTVVVKPVEGIAFSRSANWAVAEREHPEVAARLHAAANELGRLVRAARPRGGPGQEPPAQAAAGAVAGPGATNSAAGASGAAAQPAGARPLHRTLGRKPAAGSGARPRAIRQAPRRKVPRQGGEGDDALYSDEEVGDGAAPDPEERPHRRVRQEPASVPLQPQALGPTLTLPVSAALYSAPQALAPSLEGEGARHQQQLQQYAVPGMGAALWPVPSHTIAAQQPWRASTAGGSYMVPNVVPQLALSQLAQRSAAGPLAGGAASFGFMGVPHDDAAAAITAALAAAAAAVGVVPTACGPHGRPPGMDAAAFATLPGQAAAPGLGAARQGLPGQVHAAAAAATSAAGLRSPGHGPYADDVAFGASSAADPTAAPEPGITGEGSAGRGTAAAAASAPGLGLPVRQPAARDAVFAASGAADPAAAEGHGRDGTGPEHAKVGQRLGAAAADPAAAATQRLEGGSSARQELGAAGLAVAPLGLGSMPRSSPGLPALPQRKGPSAASRPVSQPLTAAAAGASHGANRPRRAAAMANPHAPKPPPAPAEASLQGSTFVAANMDQALTIGLAVINRNHVGARGTMGDGNCLMRSIAQHQALNGSTRGATAVRQAAAKDAVPLAMLTGMDEGAQAIRVGLATAVEDAKPGSPIHTFVTSNDFASLGFALGALTVLNRQQEGWIKQQEEMGVRVCSADLLREAQAAGSGAEKLKIYARYFKRWAEAKQGGANVVWGGSFMLRVYALLHQVPVVVVTAKEILGTKGYLGALHGRWSLEVDLHPPALMVNGELQHQARRVLDGPGAAPNWHWPAEVFDDQKTIVIAYDGSSHYWATFHVSEQCETADKLAAAKAMCAVGCKEYTYSN